MVRRRTSPLVVGAFLAVGAVLTAFPFFWMLTTSLKPLAESYTYPPTVIPSTVTLLSYLRLFRDFDFGRYLVNTVVVVLIGFIGMFFVAMAGYGFAKFRFRGKGFLFLLVLSTMMVPIQVTMIPTYLILNSLHLTNTLVGIALPTLVSAFNIFLFRQFMTTIPDELLEADPCRRRSSHIHHGVEQLHLALDHRQRPAELHALSWHLAAQQAARDQSATADGRSVADGGPDRHRVRDLSALHRAGLHDVRPQVGREDLEGFVHVDGGKILDGRGVPLTLRGVGLGNWLLPEGYMWKFGSPGPQSPREIEAFIQDLVGPEHAYEFWRRFRDTFITEADIERISAEGLNHVRLPINSRVVIGDDGELIEAGFALIDRLIEWCRRHELWVVLDLHGAPGGQTGTKIDDSPNGAPELFTDDRYRKLTVKLWRAIARRYRNETVVAAYDLLNEPLPNEHQH